MSELPSIPFARLSSIEKKIDVKKLPSLNEQVRDYIFSNVGSDPRLNAKKKEQDGYNAMIQEVAEAISVDSTTGQLNISMNTKA
jgi:hypothetical protein